MSVEAITWAMKQPAGQPATKLVLMILANYADAKGRAWPSQQHLAKVCGLTTRSLRKHLSTLEAMGLIRRQGRWKLAGGRYSDLYELSLGKPAWSDRPHTFDTEPDFFDAEQVWGKTEQKATTDVKKDIAKPLKNIEPEKTSGSVKPAVSAEPEKTSGSRSGSRLPVPYNDDTKDILVNSLRSLTVGDLDQAFELWWSIFPDTRKRDKQKCRKRFARICSGKDPKLKALPHEIVGGARIYVEHVNPKFARMPYTWLNNGNWTREENYGLDHKTADRLGVTLDDQRRALARAFASELATE